MKPDETLQSLLKTYTGVSLIYCLGYYTGLLSNQGEKSIDFYFIRVPLRKKVLKYGTPKPSILGSPIFGNSHRGFVRGLEISESWRDLIHGRLMPSA